MRLKILIVEDETPARAELRYLIEKSPFVEVIHEASNAKEALSVLKNNSLDVVFLDIQMPGITGIDIAEIIKALPEKPFIIFVTAYTEYAVKAFEFEALDYLLKPFDEARLLKSLKRVLRKKAELVKIQDKMDLNNLVIKKSGRIFFIPFEDIDYAEAEGDYSYIYSGKNSYLTNYSLKKLEERLESFSFFRTHRRYLVNLNRIKEIRDFKNGARIILRESDEIIPVSRRKARSLKARIKMN